MLVVVLPHALPDALASHVVMMLAETLVLLLGPTTAWTTGGQGRGGPGPGAQPDGTLDMCCALRAGPPCVGGWGTPKWL